LDTATAAEFIDSELLNRELAAWGRVWVGLIRWEVRRSAASADVRRKMIDA
jgi:hypothetical protein